MSEMNNRTVGGTLRFLEWLTAKHYATSAQTDPWKTSIRKIFVAVEGEDADYESIDWSALDLDEFLDRFQKAAGSEYKAESIVAYGRRMRNAFEAHEHYLSTGKPPTFRSGGRRQKAAEKPKEATVVSIDSKQQQPAPQRGMVTFPYPLGDGRMVSLTIPPRLKPDDVNRICAFIRTLQEDSPERRQLPPGDEEQAA